MIRLHPEMCAFNAGGGGRFRCPPPPRPPPPGPPATTCLLGTFITCQRSKFALFFRVFSIFCPKHQISFHRGVYVYTF